MESSKYYTPELSEFHVGFEYEHYNEKIDSWMPCFYDTMYDQRGNDSLDELNMEKERVKYLDMEDVKSLGFGYDNNLDYSLNGYFIWLNGDSSTSIVDDDGERFFRGIIKNKSELKRILKQIGI